MSPVDLSRIFLTYNFIIGLLLTLAGEKIGAISGGLLRAHRERAARLMRVACATFGACLMAISVGVVLLVALSD